MNEGKVATRVVIEQKSLRGSHQDLQRIATVYVDGDEYRILAPGKATGDPLQWLGHVCVRQPCRASFASEIEVTGADSIFIIKLMKEELEKLNREASRSTGVTPDDLYCIAQICLNGHVLSSDGFLLGEGEHCHKCGAVSIETCQHCGAFIRGQGKISPEFDLPSFLLRARLRSSVPVVPKEVGYSARTSEQ